MNTTHIKSGFTLIEILIVISIIGILTSASIDTFYKLYDESKYEKIINNIQLFVQEARTKSIVNESQYLSGTDSYSDARGHGVFIEKVNDKDFKISLFEDNDQNEKLTDSSELLTSMEEKNIIFIQELSGLVSESNNAANAFQNATIYFLPDPDPKARITTNIGEKLRNISIKFAHIRRDTSTGLRKKFSFDTISKISEINSYPILVNAIRKSDTSIQIISNEKLVNIADISTLLPSFSITQSGIPLIATGGSITDTIITLNFAAVLPSSGDPILIVFNGNSAIITQGESLKLEPRSLQINF